MKQYDDKWVFGYELEDYLEKGWKVFSQGVYYPGGSKPQNVYFMLETDPAIHLPMPVGK